MTRCLAFGILAFLVVGQNGFADILYLKDGNIIECKIDKIEKKALQGGSPVECYIVKDENGKSFTFAKKDIKSVEIGKTSWELRKEHREWYDKEAPKVKDEHGPQRDFAKKCGDRKMGGDLDDEAEKHYKKSYELEKGLIEKADKTIDQNCSALEAFAKRIKNDYSLYDEGQDVYRRFMVLKKDAMNQAGKLNPDTLVGLGKQCRDLELFEEAEALYREAVTMNDKHSGAKTELKNLARMQEVPLNLPMYNAAKGPFMAACNFIKKNQHKDGSFGDDYFEAGVHAHRGMTAVCAIALWAEWQLQKYTDLEKGNVIPTHLEKALLYLMEHRKGEGVSDADKQLAGDDMWGAIYVTEALALIARERPVMEKYGEQMEKALKAHVDYLKELQRTDGGWYYYNIFGPGSSSFTAASGIVSLLTVKNVYREGEGAKAVGATIDSMIPRASKCIRDLQIGVGTYSYMKMSGYSSSMSPLGASARSPLCDYALKACGDPDEKSFPVAIENWFKNVHLLMKIKGASGTHIGKAMTAPYYFLYSHISMARAVKLFPKAQCKRMTAIIMNLMLSYQEGDGAFTDWKLPTEDPAKFRVNQTALGCMALWWLMTADKDPAVEVPNRGIDVRPPVVTETTGAKETPKAPTPTDPPKDPPKDGPPKEAPPKEPKK